VIGDISSDNGHTFGTSTLVALNAISGFAGSFDITLIGSDVVSADILSVATTTALDLAGNSNSIAINFIVPVAVTVDEIRINAAAHAGTKVSISDTAALINAGLADVLMANLDIIDSISPNDGNPVLLTLAQFSTGGTITALTTALAVGTIAIDSTSATINDVNALVTNVSKLATNGISGAISLSNSQFGILTTALNTSATLTVTNTSLAATALITMDTKLTPPVNASAVMTITGTATNIAIVAASAGITKALNYVATVSGTTNSVADLNIIDANTIGVITATLTAGTVAEANVLIGTGNAYTIPLTAVAAVASDLITLDAKTTVAVDATLTTELSGSATDILAVYAANTAGTITGLGNEIVTLSDSGSIAATVLNSIDTKTSGLVTATSVTTITGSEADVKTALIAITTGTALSDTGLTNVTINDAITATTLDIVIFANTNATVTLANVPNNVITSANATVTAGKILKIDGSAIVTNTNVLNFNGSLELDGKFSITGGAGSDVITGSADADTLIGGLGNDTITGGLGADAFTGGGENDKFIIAATDSFNTVLDSISDFSAGDILHLAIPVISTIASTSADLSTAVSFASTGADSTFLAADIATAVAAQRVINANFWANAGDTIAITLSGNSVAGSNVTYIVQNQATDSIYNPTVDTVVALLDVMVPSALAHLNSTIHTLSTSKDVITATAGADVVVVNTDVGIGGDSYYSTIALAADGDSITDFAFGIDTIKVIAVKVNTFSHLTNVVIGAGGADYPTNTGLISMNGDTVYNDLGDIALNFITPNTPLSVVNLKAALQYNLTGTAAIDTITGGSLADTIDGGDGADIINAGEGDNYIVGGEGADSIISGTGADIIDGGGGADTIESGAGDDIIFGGGGADSIIAGAGNDTIAGGVEADEYVFSNYATNGLDLITDFTTASDTLSFRFVDTAIAVGGTAVASAAQQAMTNHSVYVAPIAGLAADLTTGSSITLIATDLTATTLTNVAALLGERYSVASNQNAIFILNSTITNASGNAYVYSFHNGSDTTLDAGDLVLIGLLTTAVVAVGDCI
jgi:Ca2+-binding RTX toxin-like protein